MTESYIDIDISPDQVMSILSQQEVRALCDTQSSNDELRETLRRCALAVLNCGSQSDDSKAILQQYKSFELSIHERNRGIKLGLRNAPQGAFVDGKIIKGIQENLFAVIRDILYINSEIKQNRLFDLDSSESITSAVFHILRNARIFKSGVDPSLIVCWGGHSISRYEYDYTKEVGYQLGLRGLNICTGCGPGAMKGPMKGAAIAHAKQRINNGRYIGFTEPEIIAAESPNPIVNNLVILPDIEKRLEAFIRCSHGIVVFPGGAGTAEEILYILGILLHPKNKDIPFPLIFTGPEKSRAYFETIHQFIGTTLGDAAQNRYKIVINNANCAAQIINQGMKQVRDYRKAHSDAFHYNWLMHVEQELQTPFIPTHDNMAQLNLHPDIPSHKLAANLRRAFSGIVAGNIKEQGVQAIEDFGPFEINGNRKIMDPMTHLLQSFVAQKRMKVSTSDYQPCYLLKH